MAQPNKGTDVIPKAIILAALINSNLPLDCYLEFYLKKAEKIQLKKWEYKLNVDQNQESVKKSQWFSTGARQ